MTFLSLQPLSVDLLPAALALDQRCFGGLWTLDGYQRELESPNSELLVLVKESGAGKPGEQESRRAGEGEKFKAVLKAPSGSIQGEHDSKLSGASARSTTQNSKLSSGAAQSATQNSLSPLAFLASPSPLLGLGCYWAILEEAHITMLAIDPTYQRQGLGQALLCGLMASAHQRGLERATLEVRLSNQPAIALYQKFDFRAAGQRRRYYPDNGEDALVLWRNGLQAPEFSERLTGWQQQVCDRLHSAGWQLDRGGDR